MKYLIFASILIGLVPALSFAQSYEYGATYETVAAQDLPKVKGVVRRIDLVNSKITIKHEEIPNLDMPGMTMPFSVAEPEMLQGLRNGDRVLFTANMVNGELTVMWIEKR
ncbi:MAG: copper-binding protein [Bdellovibrionales bacterium]